MNKYIFPIILIFTLAACVVPPATRPLTSAEFAAQATNGARLAEDTRATYQAAAAQETAVAHIPVQTAAAATAVAIEQGQATAVASTATSESLIVRQTEQAIAFRESDATATAYVQQTINSIGFQATATAAAQEAANVTMLQRDTADMLRNQREKERFNNMVRPYVAGVILLILVGAFSLAGIITYKNNRQVIQVITTMPSGQTFHIPIIRDGYKTIPGTVPTNEPLLLDAPATAVPPSPLPTIGEGHIMITGPSWSGKSTATRALLENRTDVVVLDPHAGPNDWRGRNVIGGGRDFELIGKFIGFMEEELNKRAKAKKEGVTVFPPLTVAIDEMPAIAASLGRDVYGTWQKWVREGWKFGLYVILSTQSTRVKTLGIEGEGDVLNNFAAVVYLGESAVEVSPESVGMKRPAVLRTIRGITPITIPFLEKTENTNRRSEEPLPIINMGKSEVEKNAHRLDGNIMTMDSLSEVGRFLLGLDGRPSGQSLDTIIKPALTYRVQHKKCQHSAKLLSRVKT